MGYYTRVSGQITIDPPLTWAEIKDSPFLAENARKGRGDDYRDVILDVDSETVDTDDGVLSRRYAGALVPATDERYKAYHLEEHVAEAVRLFGDSHRFEGQFDCEGEDGRDLWRLCVRENRVVRVDAQVVWPDPWAGTS